MRIQHLLISLIIVSAFVQSSCKKDPVKPTETNLRSLSLNEIKNSIRGYWQLDYSVGGITGNTRTNYNNEFIRFTDSDSVKWTKSATTWVNDRVSYNRVKSIYGDSTYSLRFSTTGGSTYDWLATTLKVDTLIIVDNHTNPETYYLSKH